MCSKYEKNVLSFSFLYALKETTNIIFISKSMIQEDVENFIETI